MIYSVYIPPFHPHKVILALIPKFLAHCLVLGLLFNGQVIAAARGGVGGLAPPVSGVVPPGKEGSYALVRSRLGYRNVLYVPLKTTDG